MDGKPATREIQALVGQSAGHTAYYTSGDETHLSGVLVEAAGTVWQSLRSPGVLVEIWNATLSSKAARPVLGRESSSWSMECPRRMDTYRF